MSSCDFCDELHPRGGMLCPGRRLGTVVAGKYRIDKILGIGGFGAVYAAEQVNLGRAVAIKLLHPQYAADQELVARFMREAHAQANIDHPGVVTVRDAGMGDDGCAWMEMEHLEGRDLYRAIRAEAEGRLSIERAVAICCAVLDTLAAAHARGVIHRDLKSPNVFLTADQVKLLDFGFAKIVDDKQQLTRPGELMGSLLYMSPEQYNDPSAVDGRTDLYAVGVILYEALIGKWPVEWDTKATLRRKVLTGDLERHPRKHRAEVPEWLDAAVAKAMAADRRQRFATAAEMRQALTTTQ